MPSLKRKAKNATGLGYDSTAEDSTQLYNDMPKGVTKDITDMANFVVRGSTRPIVTPTYNAKNPYVPKRPSKSLKDPEYRGEDVR